MTQIAQQSFYGDNILTGIQIPDSVTSIGKSSFEGCFALTEIHFPPTITTINQLTMNGCTSLTLAEIPGTVTTIAQGAFASCKSLTTIICHATTPPAIADSTVFQLVPATCAIYVPSGSVAAYQADSMWGTRSAYIQAIP